MRQLYTIWTCLIVGILSMCINHFSYDMTYSNDVDNAKFIQKTILRHEKKMGNIAQEIIANNSKKHLHSYKTDDYSLYLFEKDSLIDWHNATFPNIDTLYHSQKKVETTNNGWYYIVKKDSTLISDNNQPQNITAIVALKLKNNYAYENEYLQQSFHKSLKASKNSLISDTPYNETSTAIKDASGDTLFYFAPTNNSEYKDNYIAIATIIIWLISMLALLVFVVRRIQQMWLKLSLGTLIALAIYLWSTQIQLPQPIQTWDVFSSTVFAMDWWMPSLAHLTLCCSLITTIVLLTYKHIIIDNKIVRWSLPLIIFLLLCYIINAIVFHSADIILYAEDIDIQPMTIVKIVCITLMILSLLFSLQWATSTQKSITFQNFVWQVFAMSLFSLLLMTVLNNKKEYTSRFLLQSNIAFQLTREDDPVAETLLISLEDEISNDNQIKSYIGKDDDLLYEYLRNRYFDGYFSRYDLQAIPCQDSYALLTLTTQNDQHNCYEFFGHMIEKYGNQIGEKSNFYCLIDNDGRASYLGVFEYETSRLFIEINAKHNNDLIGYPKLLTNSRDRMSNKQLETYSYALYYDGVLSAEHGSLQYPSNNQWIDTVKTFQQFNAHSHLISQPTKNHTIVISYPSTDIDNFIAAYSFLVLSIFAISIVILYIISLSGIRLFNISSIQDRIQYSFVLFILALLLVFCIAQGYQSVKRYEEISHKRLSDTLTSISKVIQHDFSVVTTSEEVDNLLWRAANTFLIDINIYGTDGYLKATSRRELFSSGIASTLINPEAFRELRNPLSQDEIFVKENIGKLQYFSLYMPIINDDNQTLVYLNIPYFSDLKAKNTSLMTSFVPITNIYMLLILIAIGLSSFMTRSITKPLFVISDNIKNIALGKTNKKINYPHNDEIGILVKEYNRMLDELAYSAEKLAASERENTWREMARQIAHEIKNPLTPMKLSVQYLVKAWDSHRDDFDSFIHKVSNTLIEQIDQLSFIASEFSSLAKTPHGEKNIINICERLQNTITLWAKTENLSLTYTTNTQEALIFANGDQMTSVFNNLIKNAIQAMPSDRKALIDIMLTKNTDYVNITITDNGNGIPAEIQEKIFKPNFTTKSTGMGLGLAIVKNIILEHNGDISFTTKEGEYTTFTINLPINKSNA